MNTRHYGLRQLDWLAISLIPGIGPSRLSTLWTYLATLKASPYQDETSDLFGEVNRRSPQDGIDQQLLRALGWPEHSARATLCYLKNGKLPYESQDVFELTLRWLEHPDHHLVFREQSDYPALLNQIAVPPTLLYVQGQTQPWQSPCLGVVGARNATGYGRKIAQQWSQKLAQQGVTICSGGAKGIDAYAHLGALEAKQATVAVMGTGLLNLYPRQNVALFERILSQNGTLISEYPLTTEARPQLFPPRNRIISGMSQGVLVVEASEKSGSLISARYALEENRDVFAIPGRIDDPQASGTHYLIRQGATLVCQPDDILAEWPRELRQQLATSVFAEYVPSMASSTAENESKAPTQQAKQRINWQELSQSACKILSLLLEEKAAFDFDALIRKTGMGASDLSQTLMELELTGLVANAQGHYQSTNYQ